MKPTHYTAQEKEILVPYLQERLKLYESGKYNFNKKQERFYVLPLKSALEKLSKAEDQTYTSNEKIGCCSCVNEHIHSLAAEVLIPTDRAGWNALSFNELEALDKINASNSILTKCGYFKRTKGH